MFLDVIPRKVKKSYGHCKNDPIRGGYYHIYWNIMIFWVSGHFWG